MNGAFFPGSENPMSDVSIVIPVYNSQECLAELCARIGRVFEQAQWSGGECVLVDDCSTDESWSVICECAQRYPFVTGIHLRKNAGQDNAIMAGLHKAQGAYVVIMDDDLQHAPEDIGLLVAQCQKGYDVCFARFCRKQQAWWKNLGSRFASGFARVLMQKPNGLYLSPFKAMRRAVAKAVTRYDGPFPYVDGLILSVTRSMTEAAVDHHGRFAGASTYSLKKSIQVWLKLVTGFSVIPLRMVSLCGCVVSLVSFFLGCYYLFLHFVQKTSVEGWTTLIVTILFLGGVQLVGLGIIGEYVGRAYLLGNKKPQFVIAATTDTECAP